MSERYQNKRQLLRAGGKFRKARMEDLGIGGVCAKCKHLLIRHYDGDPRDHLPNPAKFRYRCFNCEPETDEEKTLAAEIDAAKPGAVGIVEFFKVGE